VDKLDFFGTVLTDVNGNFAWRGTIGDGWGDPEVYLAVRLQGPHARLRELLVDGSTPVYAWRCSYIYHPEEHAGEDNVAHWNYGAILDDTAEHRAEATIYGIVERVMRAFKAQSPLDVYYSSRLSGVSCGTQPNGVHIGLPEWNEETPITEAAVRCELLRTGRLSGTPPPPGGGFSNVTNSGYAWDEGVSAFMTCAVLGNMSALGVDLESGVPVPPSADAPLIAASVAASLCDLCDARASDDDPYGGSLSEIVDVIKAPGWTVRSLAGFWEAWKGTGRPRHFAVLALYRNGVNYNTPPVWSRPDPIWVSAGALASYELA
jgi:hypothetical protein